MVGFMSKREKGGQTREEKIFLLENRAAVYYLG